MERFSLHSIIILGLGNVHIRKKNSLFLLLVVLILIVSIENVRAKDRVTNHRQEAHRKTDDHAQQHRIALEHLIEAPTKVEKCSLESNVIVIAAECGHRSVHDALKEHLNGIGRHLQWIVVGHVMMTRGGVEDDQSWRLQIRRDDVVRK